MTLIQSIKKTYNKALGRHESGLNKEFAQKLEDFIKHNETRVRQWREVHPGRRLPIALNPTTKELVWLNRKNRRNISN